MVANAKLEEARLALVLAEQEQNAAGLAENAARFEHARTLQRTTYAAQQVVAARKAFDKQIIADRNDTRKAD